MKDNQQYHCGIGYFEHWKEPNPIQTPSYPSIFGPSIRIPGTNIIIKPGIIPNWRDPGAGLEVEWNRK